MKHQSGGKKILAATAHCACFFAGLGFFLVPLAIWLYKRKDIFVAHHARQAVIFQLLLAPAMIVFVFALSFLMATETAAWIIVISGGSLWLGCAMLATVRALNGEDYVYPGLRFLE